MVLESRETQWPLSDYEPFDKHHLGLHNGHNGFGGWLVAVCVSSGFFFFSVGLASIRKVLQNCLVFKSIYLVDFPITESLETERPETEAAEADLTLLFLPLPKFDSSSSLQSKRRTNFLRVFLESKKAKSFSNINFLSS